MFGYLDVFDAGDRLRDHEQRIRFAVIGDDDHGKGDALTAGDRTRAQYVARELAFRLPDDQCPPATVIVPVKGLDEGLARNLVALEVLDYPDYELIVVAREDRDVPHSCIPNTRLILAGAGDPGTGEKVNNLLAAVHAARPESQILAFADSDGRVRRGDF